ncbi:MAG: gamma carbonic anhydrase family protein [Candidatus Aminicenantes bacterium]|nr:gamma carbonic anhydrase family protein [Candidatus Aminicenantes bacterium]
MTEFDFSDRKPEIHPDTFVAEGARLIGKVVLAAGASVWFNCVLRADVGDIVIGKNSNIQDNSTIHVDFDLPTVIADHVTVGHGAILHACIIGANCLIGMGAIVLDKAVIPPNSIVGAGALIPPRKTYPEGSLILGSSGVVARKLTAEEIGHLPVHARDYVSLWKAIVGRGIGRF